MEPVNTCLPSSDGILIPGKRGRIFAQMYLPGGTYPAPTVVLCHGIPGNERLMDLAVYLREQGFAAVSFHYSGSWGSDGDYSMLHCMEDTMAVIEYIKTCGLEYFDTEKLFVCGHSMGGLMASHAGASPLVKAAVIMMPLNAEPCLRACLQGAPQQNWVDFYNGCGEWLVNFGWDTMAEDGKNSLELFDFNTYAEALAKKPVLTVAGARDTLLPRAEHLDVLHEAMEKHGAPLLKKAEFGCDHGMNTDRQAIKECIAAFLKEQCRG